MAKTTICMTSPCGFWFRDNFIECSSEEQTNAMVIEILKAIEKGEM